MVTAHHVVKRDENITVGLPNGDTVAASLVGRDPTTDLAVLRADAALTPAEWSEPESLRVGHLVLALGRPGRTVQATLGIVSALGDQWRTPAGGTVDRYLQTDVVMYPGFSGGALVDAAGKVLGVNSSALMRGTSLALPVPTLRRVVEVRLMVLLARPLPARSRVTVRFRNQDGEVFLGMRQIAVTGSQDDLHPVDCKIPPGTYTMTTRVDEELWHEEHVVLREGGPGVLKIPLAPDHPMPRLASIHR